MRYVVFGAGQTGRGFIAPALAKNNVDITFIDKDKNLVESLQKEKTYTVKYFGRTEIYTMQNFHILHVEDERVLEVLKGADVIITSIFASNINQLIPILQKAELKNTPIICIENGVNVKQPLVDAKVSAQIAEGIIFCTSIGHNDLSVTSEYEVQIPIDVNSLQRPLILDGFIMEKNFGNLIQRKIYTYNFISAVIAYFGSYKNYDEYADAANDTTIKEFIQKTLASLNPLIAKETKIDLQSQKEFSLQALKKFENREIKDSILRNARQAIRKLGSNERLLSPLKFAKNERHSLAPYICVIAAAIHYGMKYEDVDSKKVITDIHNTFQDNKLSEELETKVDLFKKQTPLEKILIDITY